MKPILVENATEVNAEDSTNLQELKVLTPV
jgi:hypothetical protein